MPAFIQVILDVLAAIPSVLSAILKIINIIKGQPSQVRQEAIQKGVAATKEHVDNSKF